MTPTISSGRSTEDRLRALEEARQRVLTGPREKAQAAILEHPQPVALIHSFAEEDLHFLIHDIGPADALPLLALASNRQWEYLLDIETWRKDRLNYPQATVWLALLLKAAPDRLIRWCYDEKLEFLELFLFRNIELRIRESDQSPSELGEGFFTDDDLFYVRLVDYPVVSDEAASLNARRQELLHQLLRRLSLFDHPRYQGLLMEAASVIPGEMEEELFRRRNVRLAEKGFLPFHEAIGVYQPLRTGELAARGKKVLGSPGPKERQLPAPLFTAAFLEGDNLFVRALKAIPEGHVLQQLQVELAGLCNQVIAADQTIIRGREQLRGVVAKVSGYVSIGLEELTRNASGNRLPEASHRVRNHLLSDIFKTGYATALHLKWRATRWRRVSWFQANQMDLTFWAEEWLGLLGGLLRDAPLYWDPSGDGTQYRDFRTLAEVDSTARELDHLLEMDRLLRDMRVSGLPATEQRLPTYKNLLLTLWARQWLQLPPPDPASTDFAIPLGPFRTFFDTLWSTQGGRRFIDDEKKAEFLRWVANCSGQKATDLADRLGSVFEALFDEIVEELATVQPGNLDPHHILLFWLKP